MPACQDALESIEDSENLSLYGDIYQFFANAASFEGCEIQLAEAELQQAYDEYEEE